MTRRCAPVHKTFRDSIKKSITAKSSDPSSAATHLHVDGEAFVPTLLRHCCLLSYLTENVMSPPSQAREAGAASSKLSNFCSRRVKRKARRRQKCLRLMRKLAQTLRLVGCTSSVGTRWRRMRRPQSPPPRRSHTRSLSCLLLFRASGLFSLLLGAAEAAVEEQR